MVRHSSSNQRDEPGSNRNRERNEGKVEGREESIKDSLKVIMGMMVDDVWKNYENYNM